MEAQDSRFTDGAAAPTRRSKRTSAATRWSPPTTKVVEIVVADDDVELKHINCDPRVTLLIFETTPLSRSTGLRS